MLHTLSPLAGGSPHNGLQPIHFVLRTLQDAPSLHSFFATVFPLHAAGAFTFVQQNILLYFYLK
jgi:hypothetical protein